MSINNAKQSQRMVGFTSGERPLGDHYPTPDIAVEKLLEHVKFNGTIWEPCCGNGAICKVLKTKGFSDVIATDLNDWGYGETGKDFLKEDLRDVDAVITNPPYNVSLDFAKRAVEATKKRQGKVAFLLRLAWLEGQKRKEFFESSPFSEVLVFSKRLPRMNRFDFDGEPSTSMIAFAWFIWDWKHQGPPTVHWI
jgi:hypothetical protein